MDRRLPFLAALLALSACVVALAPPVVDFAAAVAAAIAWSRFSFAGS